MPSPVGHILGGAAVYLAASRGEYRSRAVLGVTLLSSILPDFDFLPGILIGDPSAFHHGISHSLTVAVFVGSLVFFFGRRLHTKIAVQTATLAALAYFFHIVLDAVSVNEGTRGVPILWPWSDRQFGINLHLFGFFHHGGLYRGIWSIVRWDNLPALIREISVLGIPVLILFLWQKRNRKPLPSWRRSLARK